MPYTIGACGFIGTASSAISDFLKEFSENQVLDKYEFKLGYMTDGLDDLRYHLFEGSMKYENGYVAMQRFLKMSNSYGGRLLNDETSNEFKILAEQYINSLKQGRWIGALADPVLQPYRNIAVRMARKSGLFGAIHQLEEKREKELLIYPCQEVFYSIYPEDFYVLTKKFTNEVLLAMGRDINKNIVLNQPFPGNNPQKCMDFYENSLAIVVDRDPRDLYAQYVLVSYSLGERQYPIYNVEMFVDLYRRMRTNMPYLEENPHILRLQFEDMIYNYEDTCKHIMNFCNLKEHSMPKRYFDPMRSINNTQVYRRRPEVKKECDFIAKELAEYLYPFELYNVENVKFGDMFLNNDLNPVGRKWKKQ